MTASTTNKKRTRQRRNEYFLQKIGFDCMFVEVIETIVYVISEQKFAMQTARPEKETFSYRSGFK